MEFQSDVELREYMQSSGRSYVSFTFKQNDGEIIGSILLELFSDICPRTCDNFIKLVNGKHECKHQYAGTPIHRIVQHAFIQGGDVVTGTGKGNPKFSIPDETFQVKHGDVGILGMANNGAPHTGASQFYITLNPLSWLDGKRVAFGRVLTAEGLETLAKMAAVPLNLERPLPEVTLTEAIVLHVADTS
ncbi:hypothetical protein CEUSTIGMA_g7997.t1 [Chlamydomonas eustigma]|uniref:Peptidyl-prolyl cis-trans isomerase n=1 Tax=Chlamydomonas eustigma TaxID=1157962 RepID=A0A250XCT0_9CHLO|nr:hypothetical protein CEUSTIGMA_g7997.t1 [Chlamydomonas eustigma]|eukprot:GAX80560.1 hypothetical protein CEUSTIGMA_g7997.t1 [Chlamydomonas eustigma]